MPDEQDRFAGAIGRVSPEVNLHPQTMKATNCPVGEVELQINTFITNVTHTSRLTRAAFEAPFLPTVISSYP